MQLEANQSIQQLEQGFLVANWQVYPYSNTLQTTSTKDPQNSSPKHIESKAMQVLLRLAANEGKFLSKEDIIQVVWAERAVTDDVLTVAISSIRKATGDNPNNPTIIETRKGVGYRLIAPVTIGDGTKQKTKISYLNPVLIMSLLLSITFAAYYFITVKQNVPMVEASTKVVAVLPFTNLSKDKSQDYLADAMTEAVIFGLAESQQLRVISRTSVMGYRNQSKSLTQIGQELGAQLLVEGSVQREADSIRITAQLIDAKTDIHLWANQYDRPYGDILQMQNDIAIAIAQQVGHIGRDQVVSNTSQLLPDDFIRLMKARYLLASEEIVKVEQALLMFKQLAVEFPNDPNAHLGHAQALLYLYKQGQLPLDSLQGAQDSVNTALSINPSLSRAHACLGQIRFFQDWNYIAAEQHYTQAIALNPSSVIARRRYAWLLVGLGRFEESLAQIEQLKWLDPLYYVRSDTGLLWLYADEPEMAINELQGLLSSEPESWSINETLYRSYAAAGRHEESVVPLIKSLRLSGRPNQAIDALHEVFMQQGWQKGYQVLLDHQWFINPVSKAALYAHLGDHEQSLHWLDIAVAEHHPAVIYIAVRPEFRALHNRPHFVQLLKHLNLK